MKKSIISILTAILLVCTMGLTACNATQGLNDKISSVLPFLHKHAYVKQVETEDYFVSGATCTQKATYYYSCSCGEKGSETFEVGETLPHVYNKETVSEDTLASAATCANVATYYKSCDCGAISDTESFEYGDLGDHYFDPEDEFNCAYCDEQDLFALNRANSPTSVFFFNKELGKEQLSTVAGGNVKEEGITFDTTKSMTKLDLNLLSEEIKQLAAVVSYDLKGYLFNGGDYVVFDINLDVTETPEETADSAKFVNFRFTGGVESYGTTVHNGGWAQVLVPASALAGNFYIYPNVRMNGALYLGEAKAIAENEVIDIATTDSETTYTFAELDCVGGAYATTENGKAFSYTKVGGTQVSVGTALWSTNGDIFNQASDVVPYYVNGAIRFYMRTDQAQKGITTLRIVIKLSETVSFSSGNISVTARGVNLNKVILRNSEDTYSGEKTFSAGVDGENGYKTFTTSTAFTSGWASESFDLIILDVTTTAAGIYSQGIVSNIVLP